MNTPSRKIFVKAKSPLRFAEARGLDDALVCLKNISKEYQRFCDVMLTMPERRNELKAGSRFMDSLENLRDELLKRKSSNSVLGDKTAKTGNANGVDQAA